jgi:hypothetical protein
MASRLMRNAYSKRGRVAGSAVRVILGPLPESHQDRILFCFCAAVATFGVWAVTTLYLNDYTIPTAFFAPVFTGLVLYGLKLIIEGEPKK